MEAQLLLGLIGISSGFVIAGGVITLIVGLGIITRYAGITHTGSRIMLYENSIILGGIFGNLLTVHLVSIPLGRVGLLIMGVCSGIFVGGWIMALAEIVDFFPVFTRRLGIVKGLSFIVIVIAIGKVAGSLFHFYMRW